MVRGHRCRLYGRALPTRLALRAHIREARPLLRYYLPEVLLIVLAYQGIEVINV